MVDSPFDLTCERTMMQPTDAELRAENAWQKPGWERWLKSVKEDFHNHTMAWSRLDESAAKNHTISLTDREETRRLNICSCSCVGFASQGKQIRDERHPDSELAGRSRPQAAKGQDLGCCELSDEKS